MTREATTRTPGPTVTGAEVVSGGAPDDLASLTGESGFMIITCGRLDGLTTVTVGLGTLETWGVDW